MKRARVRIVSEILPDVIGPLYDAGFKVVGSDCSWTKYPYDDGCIVLIIEGAALPDACISGAPEVAITFTKETYGRQFIVRVSSVTLCP